MLAEVDLVGLEPFVGIAEAVDGHTHFFQASGIVPGDNLRTHDRGRRLSEHRPHHLLDGVRLESRVVMNEEKQVRIRTYPR